MNEQAPSKERVAELLEFWAEQLEVSMRMDGARHTRGDAMRDTITVLKQLSTHEPRAELMRLFAEWAAGASCDDEFAPKMVKHIAAMARDALSGDADLSGYPKGIGATPPPGVQPNPNEGPIGGDGLLLVDGGVLPPFYNTWKCSQCGKDPEAIKANGPCACGRGAALTKGEKP